MNLSKLAEPFPAEDVEWRVAQAGTSPKGIYCKVLAYITARAIFNRLDEVCGIGGWKTEIPHTVNFGSKTAFVVGLSIWMEEKSQWVTWWDVSEPSHDPNNIGMAAKGGVSGGIKRAGAQIGIGRYLYYLGETWAETAGADSMQRSSKEWNYAKLKSGETYYWKTPSLPGWALPKEPEHEVSLDALNELKILWKDKFGEDLKDPKDLREGFSRFVESVVGQFPASDHTCWTTDAYDRCWSRIEETKDPNGVSPDVPFEE